jgi:hypothetical protein
MPLCVIACMVSTVVTDNTVAFVDSFPVTSETYEICRGTVSEIASLNHVREVGFEPTLDGF